MPEKKRSFFGRRAEVEAPASALSVVVPAVGPEVEGEGPLYRLLDNMPVAVHTLLALDRAPCVAEIVVVVRENALQYTASLCKRFALDRVKKVVCAREPGLRALAAGVYECGDGAEFIALQDPMWPFVTAALLEDALAVAGERGAAAPAVPVKDTIKTARDGVVGHTPDRSSLYSVQFPQVVESSLLKAALHRAEEEGPEAADLQAALECLGLPLALTEGSYENIPVDSEVDIAAAEAIMTWRETR